MRGWNKSTLFFEKNRVFILAIIPLILISAFFLMKEHRQKAEEADIYLSEHSVFEDIYFSSRNEYLQEVKLVKKNEEDLYHVYIPADREGELRIYFQYCDSVLLDGTILSKGSRITDIEEGIPYTIQALDTDEEVMEEGRICFYFQGTLPTLYISTESGSMDQVDADIDFREKASYAVYTHDGNLNSAGYCNITGRGNTSWNRNPKPYNLNLESSASILGMDRNSDWALLANYGESMPQLKNKVAFDIAHELDMPYSPQGEFVNLYLNGKYNGLYLLASRVDVNPIEYLLEFDARYKEEINHFRTENQRVVIKEPEIIEDPLQITSIEKYVAEAEEAVFSRNGENGKNYLDYIDLESWSKIYALQDFFVQWDVEYSSFYIYKKREDSHLYAGPIWDFDLSCGKFYAKGTYSQLTQNVLWIKDVKGEWLQALGEHKDFSDYTRQQFLNTIAPVILNYLENEYATIVEPLDSAIEMASVRWDRDKTVSFDETERMYNWMLERRAFLYDYCKNPDSYCKVTFEFEWSSIPCYIKQNTAINFMPYASDSPENIVGWVDEQGYELHVDTIINNDVTYYPIYE